MVQPKSRARNRSRVESDSAEPIPVISESGTIEPDEVRFRVDELAEIGGPVTEAAVARRVPPDRLN
jgi:hypothetical protein